MSGPLSEFGDTAARLARNPLGIIALFIVLVYGIAGLTTGAIAGSTEDDKELLLPLIYFLVGFPPFVFVGFVFLVVFHHRKLYAPSDFKDERNFLKHQVSVATNLALATANQSPAMVASDSFQRPIRISDTEISDILEIVAATTKASHKRKVWDDRVLWVDDRPENNINERHAMELAGARFDLALSTDEAIRMLESNRYAAIISDMGRKEGPDEGYKLLEKIRKTDKKTPFFIYAGSNLQEHKDLAKSRGAQGSTNIAKELFELVMDTIQSS